MAGGQPVIEGTTWRRTTPRRAAGRGPAERRECADPHGAPPRSTGTDARCAPRRAHLTRASHPRDLACATLV